MVMCVLCVCVWCKVVSENSVPAFTLTTKETTETSENSRPGNDSLYLPNAIVARRPLIKLIDGGERCGWLDGLFIVVEMD